MKIRKCLLFIAAFSLYTSTVALGLSPSMNQTADQKFEALARSYIEKLLQMEPERATQLGDHRYDNRLNDYSMEGITRSRAFTQQYLKELQAIPASSLSRTN